MQAIAVIPGKPNSIHLREVPKPGLDEAPNGRGGYCQVNERRFKEWPLSGLLEGSNRSSWPLSGASTEKNRPY